MRQNFKNKIYEFLLTGLLCVLLTSAAFAKNNVSKIDIDVNITNVGKAIITERWTGTFHEGTEVYKPIEDESITIRDFKVSKDGLAYTYVDNWDVNATFSEKAYRCGINRVNNGVELCFGITEYGENTYIFSYEVDPFVKAYNDYDGFNFQFVNPDMTTFPTSINIKFSVADGKELTTDNTRIWGFGFEGSAFVNGGSAMAFSSTPLDKGNYANVMMSINKGLISPNVRVADDFENIVIDRAFEESYYQETRQADLYGNVIRIFFFSVFFLSIFIPIIRAVIRYRTLKLFYKNADYFRDTPNDGDIAETYVLFSNFDLWNSKESNIIGAIIMKMINDKNLLPIQEKSYGFFGTEKVNTSLKIGEPPTMPIVREFYDLIINAAGSDGILQENELKNYAKRDYEALNNYIQYVNTKGKNALNQKSCYNRLFGKNLKDLSDIGKSELSEVYGLRKFLDEFTLISERSIMEGVIWEDLLVYATLFGQAKKVLSELKRVYPEKIVEIERYSDTVYISTAYYRALYLSTAHTRAAVNAARAARMAAAGLGGSTSLTGGGGFSGGGHGGGTR